MAQIIARILSHLQVPQNEFATLLALNPNPSRNMVAKLYSLEQMAILIQGDQELMEQWRETFVFFLHTNAQGKRCSVSVTDDEDDSDEPTRIEQDRLAIEQNLNTLQVGIAELLNSSPIDGKTVKSKMSDMVALVDLVTSKWPASHMATLWTDKSVGLLLKFATTYAKKPNNCHDDIYRLP